MHYTTMYNSIKNAFVIILLLVNYNLIAQYIDIDSPQKIIALEGDDMLPQWSPDGSKLLFQSKRGDNISLYVYSIISDTSHHYNNPKIKFNNPVWHPGGEKVIFDSDMNGSDYLYALDLKSNKIDKLFNRKIICKNASYSSSDRQVYFTGFDELTGKWEIYSYDFIYDNLNKLTDTKFGTDDPVINGKGKLLSIIKENPFTNKTYFELINWYGEKFPAFGETEGDMICWGPMGLKLYFITNNIDGSNELWSIWKDGSHLEKLTDYNGSLSSPSISPGGSKLAISVEKDNGWDIVILPFDDY